MTYADHAQVPVAIFYVFLIESPCSGSPLVPIILLKCNMGLLFPKLLIFCAYPYTDIVYIILALVMIITQHYEINMS